MKKKADCYSHKTNKRLYWRFRRRAVFIAAAIIAVLFFGGSLKQLVGLLGQFMSLIF
jgi:hypothetical protein